MGLAICWCARLTCHRDHWGSTGNASPSCHVNKHAILIWMVCCRANISTLTREFASLASNASVRNMFVLFHVPSHCEEVTSL